MKKVKTKSSKKSLLATGLACLALLTTVSTATYAWFSINTNVTVAVSSLTAVMGDSVDISDDGSSWGSSISLTLDELDSTVTDISGDGLHFYNKAGSTTSKYVEFPLHFKASSYYKIYLNNYSSVLPHAASDKRDGTGAERKSSYGAFTTDYIAGAVRVAFITTKVVDGVSTDEVRLIWAPNSNYTISGSGTSYTLNNADTTSTKTYQYRVSGTTPGTMSTATASFLATKTSDSVTTGEATMWNTYNDVAKNDVATIAPASADQSTSVQIKVRIWLEGMDPECINPLLGGIFDVKLGFSASEITQEAGPTITTVASQSGGYTTGYTIGLSGVEAEDYSKYQVSTDGVTYEAYNATKQYVNQTVYVRKSAEYATGGIPSVATQITAGKKTQAAPLASILASDPVTRKISATSYSPSNGGALQYSLNNGSTWTNIDTEVTLPDNTKRNVLFRYAAAGDYEATASTTLVVKGKRNNPIASNINFNNPPLYDSLNINSAFMVAVAGSAVEAGNFGTSGLDYGDSQFNPGSTNIAFADGTVIAVYYPGDTDNYVSSDIVYFKVNQATGTVTQCNSNGSALA